MSAVLTGTTFAARSRQLILQEHVRQAIAAWAPAERARQLQDLLGLSRGFGDLVGFGQYPSGNDLDAGGKAHPDDEPIGVEVSGRGGREQYGPTVGIEQ